MGTAESETEDTSAPAEEANASAKPETQKPPVHSFFGYYHLLHFLRYIEVIFVTFMTLGKIFS